MTPESFIPVAPQFKLWDEVRHRMSPDGRGIITAFMQRGHNYSYDVSWSPEKSAWHLEAELLPVTETAPLGFNSAN